MVEAICALQEAPRDVDSQRSVSHSWRYVFGQGSVESVSFDQPIKRQGRVDAGHLAADAGPASRTPESHAAAPTTLALLGSAPLASTAGSRREWTGRWQFEREWPPGNAPHFVSNHSPENAPRFVCNHPPGNAPRFVSNHSTGHRARDLGNESSKRSYRNLEPTWDDRSPKSSRVRRHRHHLPATAAPALRPRRLRLAGLSQRHSGAVSRPQICRWSGTFTRDPNTLRQGTNDKPFSVSY